MKYILAILLLLGSCTKAETIPTEQTHLEITIVWYAGCTPPDSNTAIISLNGTEYVLDVLREGTSYTNANTYLVDTGEYEVSLVDLEGMHTMPNTGDLDGAVVIPGTYSKLIEKDSNILFQVFCN